MKPNVLQRQSQQTITKAAPGARLKQFTARGFEQLSILDTGGAYLLTSATTQAAIDVAFESGRITGEPTFADGAHEVEPAAWSIIFVAGDYVGWASFETQAAVNAGEQFVVFLC